MDNSDRKANLRNLFKLDECPIPDYLYKDGWGKEDIEDFVSYMLNKHTTRGESEVNNG